jgi:hypothetical protein
VAGARVRSADYPWIDGVHGAVTNKDGVYVLAGLPVLEHPGLGRIKIPGAPPGVFEEIPRRVKFLVVEHPEYGNLQPPFAACPDTVDIHLQRPATITGRVLDAEQKPVAGVKIRARPSRSAMAGDAVLWLKKSGFSQGPAKTDDEGRYSIALQHAGAVDIDVIDQKHFAKTVAGIALRVGEAAEIPDIATVAPAFITGRILDTETGKTVACPREVRLRVHVKGQSALAGVLVRPDGTYRVPVLPGTSYVYFAAPSLEELTKSWDVLEHPHALNLHDYPVTVKSGGTIEVNFPVKLNKAKVGKELQQLQGEWELKRGTYIASGNARVALAADQLADGDQRPIRFAIRGNQRIGFAGSFCAAREPVIAAALGNGLPVVEVESDGSQPVLRFVDVVNGKRTVDAFLYRIDGDQLHLVCNATDNAVPPTSAEPQNDAFVLVAEKAK